MVVAKTSEDLRLEVICQSNLGIAGFLRKIFSISLEDIPLGGRATVVLNFEGHGREANKSGCRREGL